MKITDIGCYEFDIESNADFDNRKADGINIRTVISHGRDRIIINSGKPKDLLIDEEFEVKLDHKRFVSEILQKKKYPKFTGAQNLILHWGCTNVQIF